MYYGMKPAKIGQFNIDCKEMMFYQYLPIKMPNMVKPIYEPRLSCFDEMIGVCNCDFIGEKGLDKYVQSYVYLTAKYMYQKNGCSYNRNGWHSDGFMTDDINYIYSDKLPTVFNYSDFNITLDDFISMQEMDLQALSANDFIHEDNMLLRLNQFNIHRVNENEFEGMRIFFKLSFSNDKYDLIGNSHNHLINYDWEMKERNSNRNIPQSKIA